MAKFDKKDLTKITNGKQPLTLKLKNGYINMLPNESLSVDNSLITDDIIAKSNKGFIKLAQIEIKVDSSRKE